MVMVRIFRLLSQSGLMMCTARTFWPAFGLCLTCLVSRGAEPAKDWRVPTRMLLDNATWNKKYESRARADGLYEEAFRLAPGNTLPLAAYWLVLLEQGRHKEAAQRLDEYLQAAPTHLSALRTRVSVYVQERNFPAALPRAEQIAAGIRKLAATSGTQPSREEVESLEFLGHLVGFLEKPLSTTYDQRERAEFHERLRAGLDPSRQEILERARREVIERFEEQAATAATATKEAADAAAEARDERKAEVEKKAAALKEEAQALADKERAIREKAKQAISTLDRQKRKRMSDLDLASKRTLQLKGDSTSAQSQAKRLEDEARRQQDPRQSQQLQRDAANARAQAQRIQSELERLQPEVARLERELGELENQKKVAEFDATSALRKLGIDERDVAKKQQRNGGAEKRAARPAMGTSVQAQSLLAQSRAFTTYEPMPLEEMRSNLLKALGR